MYLFVESLVQKQCAGCVCMDSRPETGVRFAIGVVGALHFKLARPLNSGNPFPSQNSTISSLLSTSSSHLIPNPSTSFHNRFVFHIPSKSVPFVTTVFVFFLTKYNSSCVKLFLSTSVRLVARSPTPAGSFTVWSTVSSLMVT